MMEDSMDIDIDIGENVEYGDHQTHAILSISPLPPADQPSNDIDKTIPEAYNTDFDSSFPVKDKLHLSGLTGVAQPLILSYISHFLPSELKHKRLEWIDDCSLNIIFFSFNDANTALSSLSSASITSPSSERDCKLWPEHPDLKFKIRQSLVSDRKQAGAKDRSAFYLFNPEWDPERRKRSYDPRYDRRYNNNHRNDKRDDKKKEKSTLFTEDMYDDTPPVEGFEAREMIRRMSSNSFSLSVSSANSDDVRRKRTYGDRDERRRSRSPENNDKNNTKARRRSRSGERTRNKNVGKELFAQKKTVVNRLDGNDLFGSKAKKDLFPNKTKHRRTDALDQDTDIKPSFADRIEHNNDIQIKGQNGISIKGVGNGDNGFNIRGITSRVKELFPDKIISNGNSGKELFQSKIGTRRRAEDMMD